MPHKKNPDVLEIIRAKYHKIVSYEFEIKSIISNLISGYNRDIQLTKKPVIDGFEITKDSLEIMKIVLNNIKINAEKCKNGLTNEIFSTDEVFELVDKGDSFRDAYRKISQKYSD